MLTVCLLLLNTVIVYVLQPDCGLHKFFVSFNMILCVIISITSILPKIQEGQFCDILLIHFVKYFITVSHLSTHCDVVIVDVSNHFKFKHTHTQPFNGRWSGTTWVGWYQKKLTHSHPSWSSDILYQLPAFTMIHSNTTSLNTEHPLCSVYMPDNPLW